MVRQHVAFLENGVAFQLLQSQKRANGANTNRAAANEVPGGFVCDPAKGIDRQGRALQQFAKARRAKGLSFGVAGGGKNRRKKRRVHCRMAGKSQCLLIVNCGGGDGPALSRAHAGALFTEHMFGQMKPVRAHQKRQPGIAGNQAYAALAAAGFDRLPRKLAALRNTVMTKHNAAAFRKLLNLAERVRVTRLIGEEEQRGQLLARLMRRIETTGHLC